MQSRNAYILGSFVIPEGATSGSRIVFDAENGRILVYDSSDELAASISPTAGVDESGNAIELGITTYAPPLVPGWVKMNYGTFEVVSGTTGDHATTIQQGLIQYTEDGFTAHAFQMNIDDQLGINLRSLGVTRRAVWSGLNGFWYAGTGSDYTVESWNNLTLGAGWTADVPCQYKLFPDGMVRLRGIANFNVSPVPNGTVLATLPAGYRPTQYTLIPNAYDASATKGRIEIQTTGVISIYDAPNDLPCLDSVSFSTI